MFFWERSVEEVRWVEEPTLRRPLLVMAFEGWFDAGEAATRAVRWLANRHGSRPVADIDPENFFDFTQQRPEIYFDHDGVRRIRWPGNEVTAAEVPGGTHDLLLLAGIEPHLRWGTFSECVVEIVQRLGVEYVVTLGANYGIAPHSRPFEVVGSSSNPDLAGRLGLGHPTYQGPTGLIGVLHDRFVSTLPPVISLRVTAPHYVQGTPNPKAAQALLRRFELVTGVPADPATLDDEVQEWEERVSEAVAEDEEVQQYVAQLEAQVDARTDPLTQAGNLAAEVEAFLREQDPDD